MTDRSSTSEQLTFPVLVSVTSSPVSESGRPRFDSPASPTTPISGPDPVRVSHSRPPVAGPEPKTLDTSGPAGSLLSTSVALQSSLANRLRAQLDSRGSTLFTLTWKERVTPSGRRICALRASVRRTSDKGCTSWPTPTSARQSTCETPETWNGRSDNPRSLPLEVAVKLAGWPTTVKEDARSSARHGYMITGNQGSTLLDTARLAGWPTPDKSSGDGGRTRPSGSKKQFTINESAQLASWTTPTTNDSARSGVDEGRSTRDAGGVSLSEQVALASWSTPAAKEAGGTPEQFLARKVKARANGAELGVSLTSLSLQAQLADTGRPPTGSLASTAKRGQLNPEHSHWLMGCRARGTPARLRQWNRSSGRGGFRRSVARSDWRNEMIDLKTLRFKIDRGDYTIGPDRLNFEASVAIALLDRIDELEHTPRRAPRNGRQGHEFDAVRRRSEGCARAARRPRRRDRDAEGARRRDRVRSEEAHRGGGRREQHRRCGLGRDQSPFVASSPSSIRSRYSRVRSPTGPTTARRPPSSSFGS
jgi:hypothetical protein